MGGDEEDDAGIDKYSSYTAAKDLRLFHVGTASGSYVENRNAALARTVVVLDATGIEDNRPQTTGSRQLYDISGRPATKESRFVIENGKKTIKR